MRTIRIFLAVFLLSAVPLAVSATAEPQGPRIYVAEPKFEFGKVTAGQRVEHVFEIRNVGDEPLEIRKVEPS